jgi:RND family efflux transporter MFP subunit
VDIAKADLAVANAQLNLVEAKLVRMEQALKSNAISEVEVIEQRAAKEKAKADIEGVKASLEKAQLNLDYTHVAAPFDGQMSRNKVDVGALIEPGSTLLATIVNDTSVYAYFNVSEADILMLRRSHPKTASEAQTQPVPPIPVELGLMGEVGYPHVGHLDYAAPEVNRSTGTIEARAIFSNADEGLLGGLFARVRVPVSAPKPALMVTERAIGLDQGQRYVLVVNDKKVVEYRPVEAGILEQGLRVIHKGLKADDWVIVNGLQRVRPGLTVETQRVAMDMFAESSKTPAASSPATKPAN